MVYLQDRQQKAGGKMRRFGMLICIFAIIFSVNLTAEQQEMPSVGEMELKIKAFEDRTIYAKTRVVALKNVRASEVEPFIKSRLSMYGAVQVNDADNKIIITDMEPKLSDLVRLVKQLDNKGAKDFVRLETQTLSPKYVLPSKLDSIIRKNLSSEGSIQTDDDLNAIMITDIKSRIERIKEILFAIDIPPKQVLIKGKILVIESGWLKNVGGEALVDGYLSIGGRAEKVGLKVGELDIGSAGYLDIDIRSFIELGIREGKVDIKSFPSLVVQNNQKGKIVASSYPNSIALGVIPHIGGKDFINLEMNLGVVEEAQGSGYYNNRDSVRTTIMVKDGDTFSIGGIEYTESSIKVRRIPVLGSIPLLGWLFKNEVKTLTQKEIIILITPHILELGESPKLEEKVKLDTNQNLKKKLKLKKRQKPKRK